MKRTCRIVDFAIPADHRMKLKESKKRDKYLDLARKLKNMGLESDAIPIVISALGAVTKGLVTHHSISPYHSNSCKSLPDNAGGARGVVVIVVGNGHGDTSSNPGRD